MELGESFFESNSNGVFSFNDLSLVLRSDFPPGGFESIRAAGSEEARVQRWFTATTYFHEMRHFHDLVGTPSGLGLFLETTRLVDDLLKALVENDDNRVPLSRQAPDAKATRMYRLRFEYLSALLGDESRPITSEEAEGTELQVQGYRFAEMGLDFRLPLVPVPLEDHDTGEVVEDQVPLGLRALMEHTATETQAFLAAIGATDDPHAADDVRGGRRRYLYIQQNLARTNRVPYFLVQRLAHYHLTTKGSDQMPAMGSLMALTAAALDIGGYARVQGQGWVYEHPGMAFAHLLALWRGGGASLEDDIDQVDGFVASVHGRSWRDFLLLYVQRMQQDPHGVVPDHLAPHEATLPLIRDIREIVLRDHLEIMSSKARDLVPWANPKRYVESLEDLPQPPIRLLPGGADISSSRDASRFLTWMILLGLIEGIMETGTLECAIARRHKWLMDLFSFEDPDAPDQTTRCHRFIERRCCGQYDGRFLDGQPSQCPFARLANRLSGELHLSFESRR